MQEYQVGERVWSYRTYGKQRVYESEITRRQGETSWYYLDGEWKPADVLYRSQKEAQEAHLHYLRFALQGMQKRTDRLAYRLEHWEKAYNL